MSTGLFVTSNPMHRPAPPEPYRRSLGTIANKARGRRHRDEVAEAVAEGFTFKEAATLLNLTESVVASSFAEIRRKFGAQAI